ncbi:MAG: glycosyltransferase [Verrucomicrobiaceae bacterium]|nr:MAG: glycosyltransferase [Verrucomicrobiaceae bacterium]
MKPRVILLAQTSPPIHGQAIMCSILDQHLCHRENISYRSINAIYSKERSQLSEFSLEKLVRMYWYLGLLFYHLLTERRKVLITTPSFHHFSFLKDSFSIWLGSLMGAQVIAWIHMDPRRIEFDSHSWLSKWWIEKTLERIDLFVPCGTNLARRWPEWLNWREKYAIPNGVEDRFLEAPPSLPANGFSILYLSSMTLQKGWKDLLGVAAEITKSRKDVTFIFAGGPGDEDSESSIRAQIEAANSSGRIVWIGEVSGEKKTRAFQSADLFVLPSWTEQFPLVLIEAMAASLPIVATDVGGVSDALVDPEGGRLVKPRNPQVLADAIQSLVSLGHDGLRSMGQRNRQRFVNEFTTSSFLRNWDTLLAQRSNVEAPSSEPLPGKSSIPPLHLQVYLADQNPKLGRSLGISRMTQVLLKELSTRDELVLNGITSKSSVQMPDDVTSVVVPWTTRGRFSRVITDHLHPIWQPGRPPDVFYFPKGFLPRLHSLCWPSVVTIHDTIIQYYADHYPEWRTEIEYRYWANLLKHTLRHADGILTISEAARGQIREFMERHEIPAKPITVTFEPCIYESTPQPIAPAKEDYVLHLGSREPHKRTAWLIRQWMEASRARPDLPKLHVVGKVPDEVVDLAGSCPQVERLPFLDDEALQRQFERARALIFPSEIEGFGLPAVEAYFLGTPVCFTRGTSIEEVLEDASSRGGFDLKDPATLFTALDEVLSLDPEQVRQWGLLLREKYAARVVADLMVQVFQEVSKHQTYA